MKQALEKILSALSSRQKEKRPFLAAIDGRCAAGKTTLAAKIQAETGCTLLHMDDFFLRPEQRTKERLLLPGGNVDWERFRGEVLLPLSRGEPFCYRPYNCHMQKLMEPVPVTPGPLIVVEGSYSCHPELWNFYGLHVFLTVSREEQLSRIKARNGEEALSVFRDRWIPLEERYFQAFDLPGRCELCLATDG